MPRGWFDRLTADEADWVSEEKARAARGLSQWQLRLAIIKRIFFSLLSSSPG